MLWTGKALSGVSRHIKTTLIAGLLVLLPVGVTLLILKFVFDFLDPLLKGLIDRFTPLYTPGMGIVALIILIYVVGLVARHFLGKRIIQMCYSIADRIPVINGIYRAARQATDVFSAVSSKANGRYSSVVLVEFPGYGLQSIGLITGSMKDKDGNTLLLVYVPTSPFPTSGFLVILAEDQVTPTDMRVDDAMKLIVSCGVAGPEKVVTYPGPFVGTRNRPPPPSPFQSDVPSGRNQGTDNRASNQ